MSATDAPSGGERRPPPIRGRPATGTGTRAGEAWRTPLFLPLLTSGDPGRVTGGYLYHRRLAELAPRFGARVPFVPLPERRFPIPLVGAPALLDRATTSADALLVDSIVAAFVGPWLPLRRPGVPLVLVAHQPPGGIDHGPSRTRWQRRMDLMAYRRADLVIAASELLRRELVAAGVPAERIRVVPPGRDPAPPPPERSDLRRGRQLALLCVANWIPRKGTLELLEAVARLPPAVATLHLVGDDRADPRYAARVRARLRRADLAGRVVVHGPVSRERVAGLYRDADAFVLPSVREPYGTVYGEAMAAGLPVVGWRAGNLPHLADHEVEGLLVQPGDVEGLARAIRRLAVEGDLRRRLAVAALARGRRRPTWERSIGAFLEHVRELLGESGRGAKEEPA